MAVRADLCRAGHKNWIIPLATFKISHLQVRAVYYSQQTLTIHIDPHSSIEKIKKLAKNFNDFQAVDRLKIESIEEPALENPEETETTSEATSTEEASERARHSTPEKDIVGISSSSSKEKMGAHNVSTILTDITFTEDENLELKIAKTRSKTQFGKKQESHLTSYILFLKSLLATIDDLPIEDISTLLLTSARFYLPEESLGELSLIEKALQESLRSDSFLSRAERKTMIQKMQAGNFSEKEIPQK